MNDYNNQNVYGGYYPQTQNGSYPQQPQPCAYDDNGYSPTNQENYYQPPQVEQQTYTVDSNFIKNVEQQQIALNQSLTVNDTLSRNNAELSIQNTMLSNQAMNMIKENTLLKSTLARYQNNANELPRQFRFDPRTDIYYTIEPNGYKTKPIGRFIIHSMKTILKQTNTSIEQYLLISYEGNNIGKVYKTLIPMTDLETKKLLKYFSYAEFTTNCSHNILEEFLFMIITRQEFNESIYIPSYAGFYAKDNETISFYANQEDNLEDDLSKILPETIKSRSLKFLSNDANIIKIKKSFQYTNGCIITEEWILWLYRVSGILSSVLYSLNVEFKQLLVITFNKPIDKHILSCLQVFNRPNLTSIPLDSTKKTINDALATSNDETIILSDCTIIDDNKKRQDSLDIVYKNLMHMDKLKTKHNIAIISNKASYILPSKNIFCLSMPTNIIILEDDYLKTYSQTFESQDAFIIDYVCKNFKEVQLELLENINTYKKQVPDMYLEAQTTYAILMGVLRLVVKIFDADFIDFQTFAHNLIRLLQESSNNYKDNEIAIVNEFSSILNENIRQKTITIVPFDKNMKFTLNTNKAILKSDLILLEEDTIKHKILPFMRLTNKLTTLLKSLKSNDLLFRTKDNRYTTTIYDEHGFSKRIDLIALKYRDIIDIDVQHIVDDSNTKDYFQAKEPDCIYIPLVTNYAGNIAYQEINFDAKENRHIFVTGKSGSGKTVQMSQLIASLRNLDEKIVIFDSSDSFTQEELSRNLSQDFVDKYVTFHQIEIDGLPINPFLFDSNLRKTEVRNRITSMLSAPFDDLSQNQVNTLKQAVSETLKEDEDNFDILGLIDTLSGDGKDGNGRVKKTVCNKLTPLAEDMTENELINQTWDEFLENSKESSIILSHPLDNKLC